MPTYTRIVLGKPGYRLDEYHRIIALSRYEETLARNAEQREALLDQKLQKYFAAIECFKSEMYGSELSDFTDWKGEKKFSFSFYLDCMRKRYYD